MIRRAEPSRRALLIDLDGTLIDAAGARSEALRALDDMAVQRCGTAPEELIETIESVLKAAWDEEPTAPDFRRLGFAMSDALWAEFHGPGSALSQIRSWVPEFRKRFWTGVTRQLGHGADALEDEFETCYLNERHARIRTFEGVSPALSHLKPRFRLILVSNGPGDLQRLKLASSGIEDFFDSVLISGELGSAKPDLHIFHRALAAAGCGPSEALMIGDDWANDVLGALRAGVDAVLVGSKALGEEQSPSHGPTARVTAVERFADLPARLQWL